MEGSVHGTGTPTECETKKRFSEQLITGKENLCEICDEDIENTARECENVEVSELRSSWWAK